MSHTFRAGLVVLGVLSAADLALPLITDGEHPPMAVVLAGAVIGLASLILIISAWRGARRAAYAVVALRVLSAAAAAPALFSSGVPAEMITVAAVWIVLTVVGVGLVFTGGTRRSLAGAR